MRELLTPSVREKVHEGGMFAQRMNDPGCTCQVTQCIECPACSFEVPEKLLYKCPKCGEVIGIETYDGIQPLDT